MQSITSEYSSGSRWGQRAKTQPQPLPAASGQTLCFAPIDQTSGSATDMLSDLPASRVKFKDKYWQECDGKNLLVLQNVKCVMSNALNVMCEGTPHQLSWIASIKVVKNLYIFWCFHKKCWVTYKSYNKGIKKTILLWTTLYVILFKVSVKKCQVKILILT